MGYVYEVTRMGRRLCCDRCGASGGVRKHRCRFGYCQAAALCPACSGDPAVRAERRAYCLENCKSAAAEFAARKVREAELLASGEWLRCSAIRVADELVRVTFRNGAGDERDAVVSREAYHAVPLLVPATPAMYGLASPDGGASYWVSEGVA